MLHPGEAGCARAAWLLAELWWEQGFAWHRCSQLDDGAFSLVLQPQPGSPCSGRAQVNSQAGEKGHAGASQESVAGAELLLELGCLQAVHRVSSAPPVPPHGTSISWQPPRVHLQAGHPKPLNVFSDFSGTFVEGSDK